MVLIWQETSRQCGPQVCQGESDEFLKEPKDSAIGGPELGPREGEGLAQCLTVSQQHQVTEGPRSQVATVSGALPSGAMPWAAGIG